MPIYMEEKPYHKNCQFIGLDDIYPRVKMTVGESIRRIWLYSIMVSDKHPEYNTIISSHASMLAEKRRHVNGKNWFVIHPYSLFKLTWGAIVTVFMCLVMILTPFQLAFPLWKNYIFKFTVLVINSVCVVDTFMTFFTGYVYRYRVYMSFKKITIHYLKRTFVIDFISTFPWGVVFDMFRKPTTRGNLYLLRLVFVFRLYRIVRFKSGLFITGKVLRIPDIVLHSLSFGIFTIIIWTWVFLAHIYLPTFFYLDARYRTPRIGHFDKTFLRDQIINAYYTGAGIFAMVGSNLLVPVTWDEFILEFMTILISFVWQAYAVAYIVHMLVPMDTSNVKYEMMNRQLGAYIISKRLPPDTKRRMELYYEHRYRKSFFREQKLLGTMSERLRREVQLHQCEKMMREMTLFQKMPRNIIAKLAPCLRMELFLPNEVIIKAGSMGDEMYFLHTGTVAIYAKWGEEIRHLEDGGYFGEVAIVLQNERRMASVTAVTVCEVFTLSRIDFTRVLRPFRELHRGIERVARERLEQMVQRESQRREARRLLMMDSSRKSPLPSAEFEPGSRRHSTISRTGASSTSSKGSSTGSSEWEHALEVDTEAGQEGEEHRRTSDVSQRRGSIA